MPGVPKDGVEIVFDDGQLTLIGHRPSGNTGYRRAFDLDDAIDADRIEASMEQGVLTLRLPKTEAAKPRRISVH
jgi:HSP20 family protein